MTSTPDTIVLVHGLWMTPRSWEHWVDYYGAKGYTVLTPGYPGFELEVEALRENPDLIAELTVRETVDHLAAVIEAVPTAPIIVGHSFGGTLTQLLVDRGLGAAAVAIDSAPTEGVRVTPPSQARSLFPVLKSLSNRHKAVGFTAEEFHYAFTNTIDEAASRAAYDRYHIPAPGSWVWTYGVFENFRPGHRETWVDYSRADRAPLLFIGGAEDHIMPPAVNKSNAKHYHKSPAVTEYHEFPGRSHWICAEPGWQEVADHALDWALTHAQAPATRQPAAD
ncbi:alpha/beta hydrolase [Nocardia takedensis]|uniref:alpha/beta hydrolase n=1 Tax=Nocardia takedensis TaxID=259390 RepID=UPI0002DC0F06|nr:alpha/beta hydrolase [Nocardia takedensis]